MPTYAFSVEDVLLGILISVDASAQIKVICFFAIAAVEEVLVFL